MIHDPTENQERLQKELLEYLDEYEADLIAQNKLTKATIRKRCGLLQSFIEYICLYHPVSGFEDIKFSWCSSGFASYRRGQGESIETRTSRNYICDFFVFIYEQHGVANIKLLKKLKGTK